MKRGILAGGILAVVAISASAGDLGVPLRSSAAPARAIRAEALTAGGTSYAFDPVFYASSTMSGALGQCGTGIRRTGGVYTLLSGFFAQDVELPRISGLAQTRSDTGAPIAWAGPTTSTAPVLSFAIADAFSSSVTFRVQVSTMSDFSVSTTDYVSAVLRPGTMQFSCPGLSDATYYWRVRATDVSGNASAWDPANGGATAFVVSGASITWVGGIGTAASNPANWNPARVPRSGDQVFISGANTCIWDVTGITITSLETNADFSGVLTFISSLTVSENIVLRGPATVNVPESLACGGDLVQGAGALQFMNSTSTIAGRFVLSGGLVGVSTSTLMLGGPLTTAAGSVLLMTKGTLNMVNGSSMTIRGNFDASDHCLLTTNDSSTYFGLGFFGAGVTIASTTVRRIDAQGMYIDPACAVTLSNLSFVESWGGATALRFMPATGKYTFANCRFDDYGLGHNVSAPNLVWNGGANYIVMGSSNGVAAGPAHEDDPNSVIFWVVPSTPVLTATVVSSDAVRWNWTDSDDEVLYRMYRSTDPAAGSLSGDLAAGLNTPATTQWMMTGLSPNTTYIMEVVAYNTVGLSTATAVTTVTYAMTPDTITIDGVFPSSITFSWTATAAAAYRVERAAAAGPWAFLSTTTFANYADTTTLAGTQYAYRLGSINSAGVLTPGVYSQSASSYTPLVEIGGADGIAVSSSVVTWTWSTGTVTGTTTGFRVYDAVAGGLLQDLDITHSSWTETGLSANRRYQRLIQAYNAGVNTPGLSATRYTLPNIAGIAISSTNLHGLDMTWDGTGSAAYRVDRSSDTVSWTTLIGSGSLTTAAFGDRNLHLAATYYYAVRGFNAEGAVALSSAVVKGVTDQLPGWIHMMIAGAAADQSQAATNPVNGDIRVLVPASSLSQDGYISINVYGESAPREVSVDTVRAASRRLAVSGTRVLRAGVTEIHFYDVMGATIPAPATLAMTLTLSYPDANSDDIVDGTDPAVRVHTLRPYVLNTGTGAWDPVPGDVTLDRVNHTITFRVTHFSLYALAGLRTAESDLTHVIVYPNPYKPGSGTRFDNSIAGEGILFDNLTARARIRIFTIAGDLVADIAESDGNGRVLWPIRNQAGNTVASGMYIYLITDPDNASHKVKGKIAVIK